MPRASRSRKQSIHDNDDDQEVAQPEEEYEQEEEEMQEEEEDEKLQADGDEDEEEEEVEEERRRSRKGGRNAASKKKSSRSKKVVEEGNDDEEQEDEEEEQENRGSNRQAKQKKQQQKKKNPKKKPRTSVTAALAEYEDKDHEEEEEEDSGNGSGGGGMQFLSQMPDQSQDLPTARTSDRNNLMKLGHDARTKAVSDLVRTILFKALAGEPIHRTNIIKEAQIAANSSSRISSAAFEEANIVLQNTFDFKLVRVPAWMERAKDLPAKCKERYYLINALEDDPNGQICKIVHGTHNVDAMEKGLLMVILSFIFCKGEPRSDGSRWLLDKELYRLLHTVDENIHAEPPAASGTGASSKRPSSAATTGTPDVDAVIEKCVTMDYLIKVKASTGGEAFMAMSQEVEETSHFYAIGPRAALEIGRSQIVHFCASILDQEPDPNMLAEIEQAEQEEEEEE